MLKRDRIFFGLQRTLTWAQEFIVDKTMTPRHQKRLGEYKQYVQNLEHAIETVKIDCAEEVSLILKQDLPFVERWSNASENIHRWHGSSELARLCFAVCRLLRPRIVLETGVGAGVTSWAILQGLAENKFGHLHSIDLPTPRSTGLIEIGYLVPKDLRGRWTKHFGPSRAILPKLVCEMQPLDLFVHDSRHSYHNQKMEYTTVWPYLKAGGILISDDVRTDALLEVSEHWKINPIIIEQGKQFPVGMLIKPRNA